MTTDKHIAEAHGLREANVGADCRTRAALDLSPRFDMSVVVIVHHAKKMEISPRINCSLRGRGAPWRDT